MSCLVAPGRYSHLGRSGDTTLVAPPEGHHSRVAQGQGGQVIACMHERDAVFVQYEIHLYGATFEEDPECGPSIPDHFPLPAF